MPQATSKNYSSACQFWNACHRFAVPVDRSYTGLHKIICKLTGYECELTKHCFFLFMNFHAELYLVY